VVAVFGPPEFRRAAAGKVPAAKGLFQPPILRDFEREGSAKFVDKLVSAADHLHWIFTFGRIDET
jgi:hypothetical protein